MDQTDEMKRIREVIQLGMHSQGIEVEDLARRSELAHTTIWRIVQGTNSPSLQSLIKIAKGLGYHWTSFLALLRGEAGFDENELLALFRQLSAVDRDEILEVMRMKLRRRGLLAS